MIESLRNDLKSELITKTLSRTPHQYRNTRIVKLCLTDAARICNVIILPPLPLRIHADCDSRKGGHSTKGRRGNNVAEFRAAKLGELCNQTPGFVQSNSMNNSG